MVAKKPMLLPKFVLSLSPERFCFARAFSFHWRTGLSFVRAGGSLEQMDLYKGTCFLTFEGSADGLHVQNFRMPVRG